MQPCAGFSVSMGYVICPSAKAISKSGENSFPAMRATKRLVLMVLAFALALGVANDCQVLAQSGSGPSIISRRLGDNLVELSWTVPGSFFSLEQAPSLQTPISWVPVPQLPVQNGASFNVSLSVAQKAQFFRLRQAGSSAVRVQETSPSDGETGVAVTRETILRFSAPLSADTVLDVSRFNAWFGNRRLLSRGELSSDRKTATLFYLENLPSGAKIEVKFDGTGLKDGAGNEIDPDNNGVSGGVFTASFQTAGNSPLPKTGVIGHVYASEMGRGGTNLPLEGAIVTVDGAEETLRAVTDKNGFFNLTNAPGGRFFVHVDGRTAKGSDWPQGAYYPFVGKAWEATPGKTNNLAGGNGLIFLPLISADTLKPVSATEATSVTFPASVIATNPALAGVRVTVPANALFSDTGSRGGRIGIAPVPPDRLPEPLPAGLQLPLVITIQTDGPMNFDQPVPVRFPNLPDPITGIKAPPGSKTVLWSFNHDTGRWEAQGTATITADGNFADTDPGVGVRQPGWHGVSPTGSPGVGPEPKPPGPDCGAWPPACCGPWEDLKKPCKIKQELALNAIYDLALDNVLNLFGAEPISAPGGCGLGTSIGTGRVARDCAKVGQFSDDCGGIVKDGSIGAALGCVPIVGGVFGLGWGAKSVIDGAFNYKDCLDTQIASCGGTGIKSASLASTGKHDPRLERAMAALELQIEVSTAASNALTRILGDPVWASMASADMTALNQSFMIAIQLALDNASPGGSLLSAQERAAILALPLPNGATSAQATALMNRLEGFGHDLLKTNLALRAEVASGFEILVGIFEEVQNKGWMDPFDGFRIFLTEFSSMFEPEQESHATSFGLRAQAVSTNQFFPARPLYYLLRDTQTGFSQRGRLSATGQFEGIVLRLNGYYSVAYFDPLTFRFGSAFFRSSLLGGATEIPTALLLETGPTTELGTQPDADADGLPDRAENIVGSDPTNPDTDGDGVPDGIEIQSDSDPLDGIPGQIGFVASISLPAQAQLVQIANDLAVVSDSSTNLNIIDLRAPLEPVLVTRYLAGSPITALALQPPLALVGTVNQTLLLNLANPAEPQLVWAQPANRVYSVEIGFGRAFVSDNNGINEYELDTGLAVETAAIPGVSPDDMQIVGDKVYTLQGPLNIYQINQDGDQLVKTGQISTVQSRYFFVEPGYAYLETGGDYLVADVSNSANPVIVSQPGASTRTFSRSIAKDSGNRTLNITTFDATRFQLSVFDQTNPTAGTNFLAGYTFSEGNPNDFVLYRGRAFAVGGTSSAGSFNVMNYRPTEFGTNPPTIQLRAYTDLVNPLVEQSVGWFRVTALVQDDGVARNVEFYLDDALVVDDGSHPFEADMRAPGFTPQKGSFIVRARAFDAAGNSAWSETLSISLTNELRSPKLLAFAPPADSTSLTGMVLNVSARFNEPLLASTLNGGFKVESSGPDDQFGTADDQVMAFTVATESSNRYVLNLQQPLPRAFYRVTALTNLTDLFGNRLLNPTNWIFAVRVPLQWVGGDGLWNDPTHWSEPRTPNRYDFVRITPSAPAIVSVDPGNSEFSIHDLISTQPFIINSRADFTIGTSADFYNRVQIGTNTADSQNALLLYEGESRFHGGLQIGGTLRLNDHTLILDSPGIPAQVSDQSITLGSYVKHLGSRFIIERGSMVEIFKTNEVGFAWQAQDGQSLFINRGVIRKQGGGGHLFLGNFQNEGTLLIEEGLLGTDFFQPHFENLGTIEIHAGAMFRSRSGSRSIPSYHGRTARFTGTGTNYLGECVNLDCEYTFEGTTLLEGELKEFRGGVRNTGPWLISGNSVTVSGLVADFGGTVTLGDVPGNRGSLIINSRSEALVRDLIVRKGDIGGTGSVRVLAPMTISNSFRLFAFNNADLDVAFDGTITLRGRQPDNSFLQVGNNVNVEFGADVHWAEGPVELTTNCVVLAGATFFAESATGSTNASRENSAGLAVRGTYKQISVGTNQIQRLINSGLIDISAGTLSSFVPSSFGGGLCIVQTTGELRLSGGSISALSGSTFSPAIGQIQIQGGLITGAGNITGDIMLLGGTIKPGAPFGIIRINDNLTIRTNGIISIDIGGLDAGVSHDQIQILRQLNAEREGTLEINLLNGFNPQIGQEFTIFTFDFLREEFRQVTGQNIGNGKRFDVIYETKAIKLRVVSAP